LIGNFKKDLKKEFKFMPIKQENLARETAIKAALEAKQRLDEGEKIALEDRTASAFKEEDFQAKHFEIVNTIMMDGSSEIASDYPEKNLRQIRHVMAKAIEQSSNVFRKFTGEDALPVYTTDKKKTSEYAEAIDITGPISAEFAQELLEVAGLEEVNAAELLGKLSFTNLLEYSYRKITGNEITEDLSKVTEEEIEAILSEVAPEENRWDFDNEVIDSINYSQGENLSDAEKKAMDLLFILMNQLWKVQQVHRATFEDASHRISSRENVDYQTYEGYLAYAYDEFSDKSSLHGLINAGYGVQKDLMIYLRK
jgi:hypothetical protein